MSKLIILSDSKQENLIKKVCDLYQNLLIDLSKSKDCIVGAWPGGRSPLKFFPGFSKVISSLPSEVRKKNQFFQVDERVTQDFNREILEQNFFSDLIEQNLISRNQVHYYPTDLEPNLGIESYEALLNTYGGKFDYIMLGAGNPHIKDEEGRIVSYDCHVAGIFANHESSKASNLNFCYYFDSPKPPPGRITATYSLLSKSDWCFLFIMGAEKKEVLAEFMNNQVSIDRAPVKIAKKIKNCVLVTDQEL